ncbi:MAG: hypothetical protein MRJ65_07485 [Candidatus Brocadiaceae bacterium]|nr:hypothetical protein [Candidatus Brocadiaceae bacterium]
MSKSDTINNHAQRVGMVANLIIFLGILGIILSILALTISESLAHRGYGARYSVIGASMIGLGYGIRFRNRYSLYVAIVLFLFLSCHFLFRIYAHQSPYLIMRALLCSWAAFKLIRSVSSLQLLIETDTYPDKHNRFMKYVTGQK